MNDERFPPGKAVSIKEESRAYEQSTGFEGRLTVATNDEVGVLVRNEKDECLWVARKGLETWRPPQIDSMAVEDTIPPPPAALRYNSNKPESDYILTYDGGVEAVFSEDFDYYHTMETLADLYRAEESDLAPSAFHLLVVFGDEALTAGDDIVHLLAETQTLGAKKYAQGNYLKGANWRQYFQCAVRHALKIQDGEEYDAEDFPHRGNFFFNILMLVHCIRTGIGTDDRIKAPK